MNTPAPSLLVALLALAAVGAGIWFVGRPDGGDAELDLEDGIEVGHGAGEDPHALASAPPDEGVLPAPETAPAPATIRHGTARLMAEHVSLPGLLKPGGVVTGREVMAVLAPYAEAEFATPEVERKFLAARIRREPLELGDEHGILGVDLFVLLREHGYEVEVREDRLWIMEVPDEEE